MRNLSLVKGDRSGEKIDRRIEEMEKFYQKVFDQPIGPMSFQLKPNPFGKEWTLIVPSWMTYSLVAEKYEENNKLPFWKRKDINLPASIYFQYENRFSRRNGAYAIAISPTRIGDEKFKKLSASQLLEQRILGMTLLERDLLGLWYNMKYKGHLDNKGYSTLCIGSRFANGEVPVVSHYMNKTDLYSFPPSHVKAKLLPREIEVISVPIPQLVQA